MLTQAIWWITNALEAILLGRAAQRGFLKAYPIFFLYVGYVLFESLARFYVYVWHPPAYIYFYWSTQFVSILFGYGVVWEICRQALARYSGAFRMARNALVLIFLLVIAKVFGNLLLGEGWSLAQSIAEQERDFRVVQGSLILAVIGVLYYYRIPIGRNLRGMIFGYGFFLGTSILNLTFRSHLGDGFQIWWQYLQPAAYVVVLLVWCVTLWAYHPNPLPVTEPRIEKDYQSLVEATQHGFRRARAHVVKAVRS